MLSKANLLLPRSYSLGQGALHPQNLCDIFMLDEA